MEKIILGIDPGTHCTGFGLIKHFGNRHELITFGVIRTKPAQKLELRYLMIFEEIAQLVAQHGPDAIAVETQFVQKNAQSALKLGMARGVAMVAGAKYNIPIFEYAPTKIKLAVTGRGNASKHQVQQMTKLLLALDKIPAEDAADALAIAICHAHTT